MDISKVCHACIFCFVFFLVGWLRKTFKSKKCCMSLKDVYCVEIQSCFDCTHVLIWFEFILFVLVVQNLSIFRHKPQNPTCVDSSFTLFIHLYIYSLLQYHTTCCCFSFLLFYGIIIIFIVIITF